MHVRRGVLEAAWNRALSATDWAAVATERAHCSDADFGRLLSATLVARAAARCFSPFAHHRPPLAPRWVPSITPASVGICNACSCVAA